MTVAVRNPLDGKKNVYSVATQWKESIPIYSSAVTRRQQDGSRTWKTLPSAVPNLVLRSYAELARVVVAFGVGVGTVGGYQVALQVTTEWRPPSGGLPSERLIWPIRHPVTAE